MGRLLGGRERVCGYVLAGDMSDVKTRPPTHDEAVAWVLRHMDTRDRLYVYICREFYEANYGKEFSDAVRRDVNKIYGARNAKKIRQHAI